MNSIKGRLLVAGPKLRERNFFKTVVLLLEHSEEGAMGLVLNRPSSLTVANALSGHLELCGCSEPLYSGGPVEPGDLFLLHSDRSLQRESHEVSEGLFATTSAEAFEKVLAKGEGDAHLRTLSGYAGWAGGQLESELAGGDWLVCDAEPMSVFETDPYELWDELKTRVVREHHLVPDEGGNPDWN